MPDFELLPSRSAEVGGVPVERSLPKRGHRTVGPWCFLDHMGPAGPPAVMRVGPHPHIGLQTVTWLLEGEVLHTDSLGSEQLIRPGQLNLMTAGRGIAHAELSTAGSGITGSATAGSGTSGSGAMHGAQLWVAQPQASRDGLAAFEHHAELPTVDLGDLRATLLLGALGGVRSPARADSPLIGADLDMRAGRATIPLDPAFEHGLAVLAGSLAVDGRAVMPGALAYLGPGRAELPVTATGPARALLLGGVPFPEEIVMWWNFVARTTGELEAARAEWEGGSERFGPVRSSLDRIAAPAPWWSPTYP